jgi:hypothetical protein
LQRSWEKSPARRPLTTTTLLTEASMALSTSKNEEENGEIKLPISAFSEFISLLSIL